MCLSGGSDSDKPSSGGSSSGCTGRRTLVSLTVIRNATQTNVTGAKNWAAIKKSTDDVIVEATTSPNTAEVWRQINWSGDSGSPVVGHENQRKLSRAAAKKYHVVAELCGTQKDLNVWVIWATVTMLTKSADAKPANAPNFPASLDGTQKLGAVAWSGGKKAAGKVVGVYKIQPAGIHAVVKSGWRLIRKRISHDWNDGVKDNPGNTKSDYWNTTWVDDTYPPGSPYDALKPDGTDQIYQIDGPNIAAFGTNDAETYNNFKEWAEWKGNRCSDHGLWYWKGRWKKSAAPQVTLKDVGTGNITLRNGDKSHFHP